MTTEHRWAPLPRAEVVKAVERGRPSRVPLVRARWWGEGLEDQYGARLHELERFPEDAAVLLIEPFDYHAMGLSWPIDDSSAHDSAHVIADWAQLDEFIARLPDPRADPQIDQARAVAERARAEGRYVLFGWWRLFFERPWQIRGMQNLLTDYYAAPEYVHRLHAALCDMYCAYLDRAAREIRPDGFWTSDDLGHQRKLFMRPQTFRTLIKPYYARIGQALRRHGLHWWLHSCGNNTEVLDDLIEVGVNVFHPVQKGTMDEAAVARAYGDRLTFLAGFDVQHALQELDPAGVRAEVRRLIDTFDRPDGGMCIAAGNGIVAGTPFENIAAFLDEALRYGAEHRARFR